MVVVLVVVTVVVHTSVAVQQVVTVAAAALQAQGHPLPGAAVAVIELTWKFEENVCTVQGLMVVEGSHREAD